MRQELIIAVPDSFGNRNIPALLQQLGLTALAHNCAFLRGEVIAKAHPVFLNLQFFGFVAAQPAFAEDDEFAEYMTEDGRSIVLVWMIPIFRNEIEFIRNQGWDRFESEVIQGGADLVELDRCSVIT